jgi:flagellar biosynthesis protein FlhF
LVSTDTYRVASADQLRSYASILGVPCEVVETPAALAQVLEENASKEAIFIDFPGFGAAESELMPEWAPVLVQKSIDVQLVLPATTRYADLGIASKQFQPLNPSHLVFTHVDATKSFGGMLSLAMATGIPISFLSRGQSIPEDIEPVSRSVLLRLLGGGVTVAAAAA